MQHNYLVYYNEFYHVKDDNVNVKILKGVFKTLKEALEYIQQYDNVDEYEVIQA